MVACQHDRVPSTLSQDRPKVRRSSEVAVELPVDAVEVEVGPLDLSRSSWSSHESSLARTGSNAGFAVRRGSAVGIQTDLVVAYVPMLDVEARKGRDIQQRSYWVDSHHDSAAACCIRPLEDTRRGACHGGHMVGSHRGTPRCWRTRQKGRAVMSPYVGVANGSRVGNGCRVDSSGVGARNVDAATPLAPPPPPACERSAVWLGPGPPRYGVDCEDGAIARHCRTDQCRLRTQRHSSSRRL